MVMCGEINLTKLGRKGRGGESRPHCHF